MRDKGKEGPDATERKKKHKTRRIKGEDFIGREEREKN